MSDNSNELLTGILALLLPSFITKIIKKLNLLKGVKKMEIDIVDGQIGKVGSYDLEFKGGKLKFELKANHQIGVGAGMVVEIEAAIVLDALKAAIPSQIDDAIIEVIKNALKS